MAIIIIIILLLYFIWRTNVYVYIEYRRSSDNDYFKLKCVVLKRITLYQLVLPSIDATEKQGIVRFKSKMAVKNRIMVNSNDDYNGVSGLKINLKKPRQVYRFFRHIKFWLKAYRKAMIRLMKNTDCEYFYWKTSFGADDAGTTCVAVGCLWMLKGVFINSLAKYIKFQKPPSVNVVPIFDEKKLSIDLECIFTIRLGHVIKASVDSMIIASRGVNWRWLSTQYKV